MKVKVLSMTGTKISLSIKVQYSVFLLTIQLVSFSVSFDLDIKANLVDNVAYEVHHSGTAKFFFSI